MMFTVITRCLRKAAVRAGLPLLSRTPFGVLVRDAQDAKHLPYARLRLRSTSVGAERSSTGRTAPAGGLSFNLLKSERTYSGRPLVVYKCAFLRNEHFSHNLRGSDQGSIKEHLPSTTLNAPIFLSAVFRYSRKAGRSSFGICLPMTDSTSTPMPIKRCARCLRF